MEKITEKFTVPGYYKDFRCKGGACRHTCCGGLAVNITQEEYFRLVGMECSPALRSDLDLALKPLNNPDPYRYACILPNFYGQCRLLDEKGLCRLQKECGYDVLTSVCKYFPRSPRMRDGAQCATANACEETLELLYESETPWTTETNELTFYLAGAPEKAGDAKSSLRARIQRICVDIMSGGQNVVEQAPLGKRQATFIDTGEPGKSGESVKSGAPSVPKEPLSIFSRLAELEAFLDEIDPLMDLENTEKLQEVLEQRSDQMNPVSPQPTKPTQPAQSMWAGPSYADAVKRLVHWAGETYPSVQPYCVAADLRVAQGFDEGQFRAALAAVRAHFPKFDEFLTKAMVNEMFYHCFPFAEPNITVHDAGEVLRHMVGMLVFLAATNLNESGTETELIDLFAGFFRMADLTAFHRNSLIVIRREHIG
jgi:hypothetical protein